MQVNKKEFMDVKKVPALSVTVDDSYSRHWYVRLVYLITNPFTYLFTGYWRI